MIDIRGLVVALSSRLPLFSFVCFCLFDYLSVCLIIIRLLVCLIVCIFLAV